MSVLVKASGSFKSKTLAFCQERFGRELGKTERVVNSLNPYTSSADVKLLLDLVANNTNLGVALKLLAFLELDIANNWKPFKPQMTFYQSRDDGCKTLSVTWKDPLAVLYLTPLHKELELNYGIEVNYKPNQQHCSLEKVVEIVGYDETRFFKNLDVHYNRGSQEEERNRHVWQNDMESGSISSYSIMGGDIEGIRPSEDNIFEYRASIPLFRQMAAQRFLLLTISISSSGPISRLDRDLLDSAGLHLDDCPWRARHQITR